MIPKKTSYIKYGYIKTIIISIVEVMNYVLGLIFGFYKKKFFQLDKRDQLNNIFIPNLVFDENGKLKCIACRECLENCPSNAITIDSLKKNNLSPKKFEIDFNKCLLCGECLNICQNNALRLGTIKDPCEIIKNPILEKKDLSSDLR